jgi:porphobilinogen synthase
MKHPPAVVVLALTLAVSCTAFAPGGWANRVSVRTQAAFDPTAGDNAPMTRNNYGTTWLPQRARPRRNRKSEGMRSMVRETVVAPCHLIYPLFIHDGDSVDEISSMPGCFRHSLASMMKEVGPPLSSGAAP